MDELTCLACSGTGQRQSACATTDGCMQVDYWTCEECRGKGYLSPVGHFRMIGMDVPDMPGWEGAFTNQISQLAKEAEGNA